MMASALQPRKHRHRTTFLGLGLLLALSVYLFVFQARALSPAATLRRMDTKPVNHVNIALETLRQSQDSHRKVASHHSTLTLQPEEELAAVSSFLASLPQNVIPPYVDPARPIDPHLVVDFDTRSPRAADEVREMMDDVWTRNPVFLYSRMYSPLSREVKAMLAELHLKPAPTIIDVDIRDDAEVLEPLVQRLASAEELPVLIVGGTIVGDIASIRALYDSGELKQRISDAGAVIDGAKKKHKK